jgi:hypothetical protein
MNALLLDNATAPIRYSRGRRVEDVTPDQREAANFSHFCAAILADRAAGKGPHYICGPLTGKRCTEHAAPRNWLALDCDGGLTQDTYAAVLRLLNEHDVSSLVYTTASSKPEALRCRIIVELDREAPREEIIRASIAIRARMDRWLAAHGFPAPKWDESCDRPEQPLYLPPVGASADTIDGHPVNLAELLPVVHASPRREQLASPGGRVVDIDRHGDVVRLAARLAREVHFGGLASESALAALDAEAARGRWTREVPDDEIRKAFQSALGKCRRGEWTQATAGHAAQTSVAADLWQPHASDRFTADELSESPLPTKFVLAPYIPAGCACILTGAGGTSKTGLAVTLAVAICTGREFLGVSPCPGRVLYASAEDRREVLHRHVYAATRDLTYEQRELVAQGFYVKDLVGSGFLLTRHQDGATATAIEVTQLIEYARELRPHLIVFDTLSRLHGGEEDNADLARFVSSMEEVCVATGAAALALHHTGKAQMRAEANDQYAGRGGSALSDNARSVLHLARVTPGTKDSPTNGSDLIADGRLLRLSHVKSNYAAAAPDRFLERVATPHAALIREFSATFARSDAIEATWLLIRDWLASHSGPPFPTKSTIEGAGIAGRNQIRLALEWATDQNLLAEIPHPDPKGGRKTYVAFTPEGLV